MSEQFTLRGDKPYLKKDPNAVLDYYWDWTDWLATNADAIQSATVLGDSGLVVGTVSYDANIVKAILSAGNVGTTAHAICRITTVGGRTEDRTLYLQIRER